MHFSSPLALLLLLVLPAVTALGWPSRGYGRRREIASLVLRLVILLSLILALAGLSFSQKEGDLATVFLIDVSDSMPEEAIIAEVDYVRQALERMGPDDQAAIVVFGGEALVERSMSPGRELSGLASIPSTNATDIAEAIRLALALYPPGFARRLVLLSDGIDTGSGEDTAALLDTARLAAASGVEIIVVPFIMEVGPEVILSEVNAPHHLRQGERFDLRLTLYADRATRVDIRVLEGTQMVYQSSQELVRGRQSFSLPLTASESGFTRYLVQVTAPQDRFYQNNELATFAQIEGPPRVLLVFPQEGEPLGFSAGERPDETSALMAALQASGYKVEAIQTAQLSSDLAELTEYACLFLVDVPARQLSQRQMQAVQTYVRDLGGGLVTVGGPTSYGLGGYFRTPLEEMLPVEIQIKDEQRRPSLTIVFVIDHSGSMSEINGGITKLELAKEAAIRSVELLSPTDQVGVIAFDDTASWVVPITSLDDPGQVINTIGQIRAGGGTDILAGLQAMAQALPLEDTLVKHVILLTDGGADPTGIPELVKRLYRENGITLSTVGVGRDAAPFLKDLSDLGGGRYHFTIDPSTIPTIFTEETTLATRAYLVEEAFYPQRHSNSPILSGIDAIPPLYGYVGTSPKETAQTILISGQGDPILAVWQYGLGKVVAFTSDAAGRWAKDWLQWQGFPLFWAQAARYTIGLQAISPLEISVEPRGEEARLLVDAYQYTPSRTSADNSAGESDPFLNDYRMQAHIVSPDGSTLQVELPQMAPGRYEGMFTPTQEGAYLVRVSGVAPGGEARVAETGGWVLSYSAEYCQLDAESSTAAPGVLARIAAVSEELSHQPRTAPSAPRPVWPWLLVFAAVLLPFDIAVRRLAITRTDLRHAWGRIASRFQPRPGESALPSEPPVGLDRPISESISASLLHVKERFQQAQHTREPSTSTPSIQRKVIRREAKPQTEQDSTTTASALLQHKRRIWKKRNDE